jgi:hypothetical protein
MTIPPPYGFTAWFIRAWRVPIRPTADMMDRIRTWPNKISIEAFLKPQIDVLHIKKKYYFVF